MKTIDKLIILIIICIITIIILYFYKFREHIDNNPIDALDAIIYINLENRQDRKDLLLKELDKLNIPKEKIFKISGVYMPKNGHKGCIQSHILALNLSKLNNWNNVLILEDDAELNVIPDEFKNNLRNILKYLESKEWDIIMLATAHSTKEDIKNNIVKIKSATTSSAYIINKNYINKILDLFNHSNNMMDNDKWTTKGHEKYALDQMWMELQQKDNWYGFKNDLIKQRNTKSSINEFM